MAIYIKIKKIAKKNRVTIYQVSQDEISFYIGINQEKNEIEIYENDHFEPANIIKLNDDKLPQINEIPSLMLAFAILKAFKALRKPGELPEDISYCA